MTVTVSITETAILRAVGDFLTGILDPACQVVRGQVNRVSEPTSDNFIVMWPLSRNRLATNIDTYNDAGDEKTLLQKTEIVVQLDVHGPVSTDNTQIITTMWRDAYGCAELAASGIDIQPLYIDGGTQAPFVNGENQYEDRWVLTAHLQANPTVMTAQQSANALQAGLIEVDAEYPPS